MQDIQVIHAKRLGQAPKWSDWFQYPEKSGGALFDLHIHDIDYICALLGEVATVYAVGHQNAYGAWDHVMTTLTFNNNSQAFVEASHRMPPDYPFSMTFRAQTPDATLDYKSQAGDNIDPDEDSHTTMTYYSSTEKTSLQVEATDPFQQELIYFIHCLEANQDNTIIPLSDVLYTLKLLKAIERSLETKKVISMHNTTRKEGVCSNQSES
nr:Gfo/Idh/MocA family oxidoreductase [Lentibacillus sp. JNUCC-1]